MDRKNAMSLEFDSKSENESFARIVVAAFAAQLNPTIEEIADIKTAVSEAVTNSIIHGYDGREGKIVLTCAIEGSKITVSVMDNGKGIEDIKQAMEPLYTTKPEMERSGMGFAFMEAFMDDLEVISVPEEGTTVTMTKTIDEVKLFS
ncbi:MAG TPA: anti-sigma F factor [Lachnospiraceae bacterium]|uniref:anti-sigma F factor n=1 Tax=Anaerosporobacter sp. TaxID=1872529 RepID=UPI000ED13E54|nr:anti-sigma F factor [Anaerosporobacter sp.]HAB59844.1 anti-sigma F factor [Lachnospiraceae bacterium]